MILYEYDINGWLIGWHEDANRMNSTPTPYAPIHPSRARFVTGTWVEDASREHAQPAEQMRSAAIAAVQARLDQQAQEWGYDSIFTAVTYADEPSVPQFQTEGRVLRAWRSETWAACYASTATTLEALLAELPPIPERPIT